MYILISFEKEKQHQIACNALILRVPEFILNDYLIIVFPDNHQQNNNF